MSDAYTNQSGGVYGSERVRHFASQCGEVYKRCMMSLIHNVLSMRQVDPRMAACDEGSLRRYGLESLREWPQSTRDEEARVALREHPEMEANYKFAFVLYARNFYGTDQYGNRNALDLRIPPFSYFLFELYSNGLEEPNIIYEDFYEDRSYWKFTKALVRKTLCEVTKGRVTLQVDPRASAITHVGSEETTNFARPTVAVTDDQGSQDSYDSEEERERRHRRHNRERRERRRRREERERRHRHDRHNNHRDERHRPRPSSTPAYSMPTFASSLHSHPSEPSVDVARAPPSSLADQSVPVKILTLDGGSNEMPERNTHDGSYKGMGDALAHSDSSSQQSTDESSDDC